MSDGLPNENELGEHIEAYGDDPAIASFDAPVPRWLIAVYLFLPLWGICTGIYFWNGSSGWLDRGYWGELQRAANTTYPFEKSQKNELDYP